MAEDEPDLVLAQIDKFQELGTASITRVEVAAALAKAARDNRMAEAQARDAEKAFLDDCADFKRVGFTDDLAICAGGLAWKHGLRGYDAVQLASALAWRDMIEEDAEDEVVFACFDDDLRQAANTEGLKTWPD